MGERALLSDEQLQSLLVDRSNWGRWGVDDQRGTVNLLTDAKRLHDLTVVREGRPFSLARLIEPGASSESGTATCEVSTHDLNERSTAAMDYFGLSYHGFSTTHLDALCHIALDGRLYNDRDAGEALQPDGARWGDVTAWAEGITTRAVLLDVPHHRGTAYVTPQDPVRGEELEQILTVREVDLNPGDAVLVHSGRTAWDAEQKPWHTLGPRWRDMEAGGIRPGLDASCMQFLRDHDVSVLLWDMLDHMPSGLSYAWSVHGAIAAFGLAVVDNVASDALAEALRQRDRSEFLLVVAPLPVRGGTGSPVSPLALI
ncbi:MAG: cyclase family protein [Acidimicrobiales bacterium]